MARLKVFIDTNIWFSTLFGSANCQKIIEKHISNEIEAIVSQDVLTELIKNISGKIPHALPALKKLLEARPPKIVKSPPKIDQKIIKYVNFKDRHIFQAFINSESEFFITGNLKDFDLKNLEKAYKVKIMSPKDFLLKIGS